MKTHPIRLLILLFLLPLMAHAQEDSLPLFITDSLDSYIARSMKQWDIPGMSVAIVKDGRTVHLKGYGLTEKNGDQPVDEHTLFMIASNVKAFTATALTMLASDGKCSLDDKVTRWLPDFKLYDPVTTQEATLRDLLVHNLGYSTFQADFLYFYSDLQPADVHRTYAQVKPPFAFREKYGYSNIGYYYAGECIERISGMTWDQYLDEKILKPLGMDRTRPLSAGLGNETNIAFGHTLEEGVLTRFPHTNIDLIGPAASMSSTANDLAHWLNAQLAAGTFNNRKVIPEWVIQTSREPNTIVGRNWHPFNKTHYSLYGLGWTMEDYEDVEVFSHTGGIWGFVSGVSFVPELGLGIVILTNSDENWLYEALKWEITDAFMELPYRNYTDHYYNIYRRRAEARQATIASWKDMITDEYPFGLKGEYFEGTWQNDLYGDINIKKENNGLSVSFDHHPGLVARLQPLSDGSFLCTYTPSRFGIHKLGTEQDENGRPVISFKVADRLDYSVYPFKKSDTGKSARKKDRAEKPDRKK